MKKLKSNKNQQMYSKLTNLSSGWEVEVPKPAPNHFMIKMSLEQSKVKIGSWPQNPDKKK